MSVLSYLGPHVRALEPFASINVLTNLKEGPKIDHKEINAHWESVPLKRPISFVYDVKAFVSLYRHIRRLNPTVVHTVTPKAGLLGILAAWLARVPVRVHTFTGQVWATRRGLMRWLLKFSDKLIAKFATDILVDSHSQQNFLINQGILDTEISLVLGSGSICGVNVERFHPSAEVRSIIRERLSTPKDAFVCLYVGRLNREKGVLDLAKAFAQVASMRPSAELWVVGPDEGQYIRMMQALLTNCIDRVRFVGFTPNPELFMQAADLYCLPSYREGFGSSVIEAAACAVPALVSKIYGLEDAVIDGRTGWIHEAGNWNNLAEQLDNIISNPEECVVRGKAALNFAKTYFAEDIVICDMIELYKTKFLK